jgi:hypothetical protein
MAPLAFAYWEAITGGRTSKRSSDGHGTCSFVHISFVHRHYLFSYRIAEHPQAQRCASLWHMWMRFEAGIRPDCLPGTMPCVMAAIGHHYHFESASGRFRNQIVFSRM